MRGALEAVLLVADEPVPAAALALLLDEPQSEVEACLSTLAGEYAEQDRGFDLREVAGGWRFYTRGSYADVVERFVLSGQRSRLTPAALETLAILAYRQPVTRGQVTAIRGVNTDGVIRTLIARGLVAESAGGEGGATLLRTTDLFLERMGLSDLAELPPLAPMLPDITDVDDLPRLTVARASDAG